MQNRSGDGFSLNFFPTWRRIPNDVVEHENDSSILRNIWNSLPPPQDDAGCAWESAIMEEAKSDRSIPGSHAQAEATEEPRSVCTCEDEDVEYKDKEQQSGAQSMQFEEAA